jgi:hypothetical protein
MTARVSAIRVSIVGSSLEAQRIYRPTPRGSNWMIRANDARRTKERGRIPGAAK